jgi:hypothetical protein
MLKIMDFNKGYLTRELNNKEGLKLVLEDFKKQTSHAEKEKQKSNQMKVRIKKILKICRDNK